MDFLGNRKQTDFCGEIISNSSESYCKNVLQLCSFSAHKLHSCIYQGIFIVMGLVFLALACWISQQGICFFYFNSCENIKGLLYLLCGGLAVMNFFFAWQMRGFREAFRKVAARGQAQLLAVRRHKEQQFRCQGQSAGNQKKIAALLYSFHRAQQQGLQYATQTYLILLHIESSKLLTAKNKERLIDQNLIDLQAALNTIAINFDQDV